MADMMAEQEIPCCPTERRATVLLVDDHPSIRLILSAGLKAHGFDVLTAGTAEKAMALCEAFDGPIDILLADVGLTPHELWPVAGSDDSISHGVALADQAVRLRPGIKVVLFTGYSDERLKLLGADIKRFFLLHKPCGLPTLVSTFRQLLQSSSKHGTVASSVSNNNVGMAL